MSRSGYSDDCDGWELICWRGAVASSIRGKRGQAFLREMLAALDALPKKELIAHDLVRDGEVCAIGSVVVARGVDVSDLAQSDEEFVSDQLAKRLGIARALAKEIMSINDEDMCYWRETTPERRYEIVRKWVVDQIKEIKA
jgi:hypothetical protein